MIDRISDIYTEVKHLAIRTPDGKTKTDKYTSTQCLLRIANDILKENNLKAEMDKRVDMLEAIVESDLQEVKQ